MPLLVRPSPCSNLQLQKYSKTNQNITMNQLTGMARTTAESLWENDLSDDDRKFYEELAAQMRMLCQTECH